MITNYLFKGVMLPAIFVCFSSSLNAQNCFSDEESDNNESTNKRVAKQLAEFKNINPVGYGMGKRAQYTGRHKILKTYSYHKNDFGIITGRSTVVQAVYKDKDGKCVLKTQDVYQEAIENGKYGSPNVGEPGWELNLKYVDCDCVMKTRDWMDANATSDGESSSTSDKKSSGSSKKSESKGPKDGPYIEKYPSGNIHVSGAFKGGQPDGVWKELYENGQTKVEGTYINGLQEGAEIVYDENGKMTMKSEYKNGKKNGKSQTFEKNAVTSSAVYADDKLEGEKMYYDTEGNKLKLETYKNNQLHGPYKEWRNGKLVVEGSYADGIKHGSWKEYNPATGKVTSQTNWKDGVKE